MEARTSRRHRVNTQTFPLLRFVGMMMVALLAYVQLLLAPDIPVSVTRVFAGLLCYGLVAGAVLRFGYSDEGWGSHLSTALFALDIPVFTWVVYETGAARSYLFLILFVRIADQVPFSFRRVLSFTHLVCLCYTIMLLCCDSHSFAWGAESFKIISLYICGLYVASTAGTNKRLRERLVDSIRHSQDQASALAQRNVELQQARLEAESADRARSRFLRSVNHELRTPLNGILGFCQMLSNDINPQKRGKYLANIEESGHRLLSLVDRILVLTEGAQEKVPLSVGTLSDVIAPVLERAESLASKKQVNFTHRLDGDCTTLLDIGLLQELLRSVLEDGLTYASTDGSTELLVECTGSEVRMLVTARCAEGQSAPMGTDWGLHLTLEETLAEMQGGQLRLLPPENGSRTVVFELPVQT